MVIRSERVGVKRGGTVQWIAQGRNTSGRQCAARPLRQHTSHPTGIASVGSARALRLNTIRCVACIWAGERDPEVLNDGAQNTVTLVPARAGQKFEIFKCFKCFKKYLKNVSGPGNI